MIHAPGMNMRGLWTRFTTWRRRHPLGAACVGLFVLSVPFGWELLVPGRSLFRWDTLLYTWPLLVEARESILSGRLPFWSASVCCGTPLLANINGAVLYPPRLLCWLLPLRPGYHLFLFLHVWASLGAVYVLCRAGMKLSRPASVVGALTFAGSGYMRGMWDTHNFLGPPWVAVGLTGALWMSAPSERRAGIAMALAGWAMCLLSGDVQSAALLVPVAALLVVSRAAFRAPARARARDAGLALLCLGASIVLSLAVTAFQWIPAFEAAADSYRAGGLPWPEATERSFHPIRVFELVLPHLFGTHGRWFGSVLAGEGSVRTMPWTASFHVGLLPLLLAALNRRGRRRSWVAWASIVAAGGVLLSFGRFLPGFPWLQGAPLMRGFRYPEKYLLWATLGLAVLAACGAESGRALLRAPRRVRYLRPLIAWTCIVAGLAVCGALAALSVVPPAPDAARWVWQRALTALTTVGGVWVAGVAAPRRAGRWLLPALVALELLALWRTERPTTRSMDPLEPPDVARVIRDSGGPSGRFLLDPACRTAIPVPSQATHGLTPEERATLLHRHAMAFGSPWLWGIRTVGGFSPLESAAMRAWREPWLNPFHGDVSTAAALRDICVRSGVTWLLTTKARAEALRRDGLDAQETGPWQGAAPVRLLRLDNASEAELLDADAPSAVRRPAIRSIERRSPERIRIGLNPGAACRLLLKESYARGWRACNERSVPLDLRPAPGGVMQIDVPAGTREIRLRYSPPSWYPALALSLVGTLVAGALWILSGSRRGFTAFLTRPAAPALAGCMIYAAAGLAARGGWACTFDEGFHLTRGLALNATRDSRLSYFHPPLQNLVCAYLGKLAFGHRLAMPQTPGWRAADVFRYAPELAAANPGIFGDLVRASRSGSLALGVLLIAVSTAWAFRAAGPLAAWTAAAGLSLSPNFIAHGNLTTTDMGVTAFVVSGTYALWLHAREGRPFLLAWSGCCFALAAATKHTGLIWFSAFCAVCIPVCAWQRRRPALLWLGGGALLFFLLVLAFSYGLKPQTVRAGPDSWWSGRPPCVAGRYIEGLVVQSQHALEGHRGFFAGRRFTQAEPWYLLVAIAVKTPLPWCLAMAGALAALLRTPRPPNGWIAWVPALVFAAMLFGVNRILIGVRHALPLLALGTVCAAVWVGRWPKPIRRGGCAFLLLSSLCTATMAFPDFISYGSLPFGGTRNLHRWVADSNYDWGQDLDAVREAWPRLTEANGGRPPRLVYFGFLDPRVTETMDVGEPALCGFMGWAQEKAKGAASYERWLASMPGDDESLTVASVSAMAAGAYGIDFSRLEKRRPAARIGRCVFVYGPGR